MSSCLFLFVYLFFLCVNRVLKVSPAYQADQACLAQRFVEKTKPNALLGTECSYKNTFIIVVSELQVKFKQSKEVCLLREHWHTGLFVLFVFLTVIFVHK